MTAYPLTGTIESAGNGHVVLRTDSGLLDLLTTHFDGPLFRAARGLTATVFAVELPDGRTAALVRQSDVARLEQLIRYGAEPRVAVGMLRTLPEMDLPAKALPMPLMPLVGAISPSQKPCQISDNLKADSALPPQPQAADDGTEQTAVDTVIALGVNRRDAARLLALVRRPGMDVSGLVTAMLAAR